MITRKRARLDKRRALVLAMRRTILAADDPIQRWSVDRIRRVSRAWARNQRLGRPEGTWRSRRLYGARTGGRW